MFSGKKSEHFNIFFILLASMLWINTLKAQKTLVVDQHGKGDYKTIQEALDAVPTSNAAPVTIFVKKGVYREVIIVDARKDNILLKGEDKYKTIISYNNHLNWLDGLNNCQKNKLNYTL
jgi:pectinesterase